MWSEGSVSFQVIIYVWKGNIHKTWLYAQTVTRYKLLDMLIVLIVTHTSSAMNVHCITGQVYQVLLYQWK